MLHIEPAGKRPKAHLIEQDCQKQMTLMRCRAFQRMNQHFLRSAFHVLQTHQCWQGGGEWKEQLILVFPFVVVISR